LPAEQQERAMTVIAAQAKHKRNGLNAAANAKTDERGEPDGTTIKRARNRSAESGQAWSKRTTES